MKNFVQNGDALDLIAPAGGVVSGGFYLIGGLLVCAATTAAAGEIFVGDRKGVFKDAPKTTAQAWAQGAVLYWDDTAKKFTTTVGTNTKVGAVVVAGLAADAVGTVLLAGLV